MAAWNWESKIRQISSTSQGPREDTASLAQDAALCIPSRKAFGKRRSPNGSACTPGRRIQSAYCRRLKKLVSLLFVGTLAHSPPLYHIGILADPSWIEY